MRRRRLGGKVQPPRPQAQQEARPGHDAVAIADARAALGKLAAGTGEYFPMLPCPVAFTETPQNLYAPAQSLHVHVLDHAPAQRAGRTHGPSQRLSGDNRRRQVADPLLFPVTQETIVSCADYGQSGLMKAIGVTFASGGHDRKEPNGRGPSDGYPHSRQNFGF